MGAVVVSDVGFGGVSNPTFTADFVQKVLQGSGPNTPMVLLPVSNDTMTAIKAQIDSLYASKAIDEKTKNQWLSSLVQVQAPGFTWQQDYFQSFANSKGQTVLRPVQNYGDLGGSDFNPLAQAAKDCGFVTGPPLTAKLTDKGKLPSGAYGGNIQTLPPGICALGDDSFGSDANWSNYADQFCGKDRLKVPTSWLKVGHTDEVMKVVRDNTQSPPCNFAVTVASPREAMNQLKQENPQGLFITTPKGGLVDYKGLEALCHSYDQYKNLSPQQPGPANQDGGVSRLFRIIFPSAQADDLDFTVVANPADVSTDTGDCASKLTNGDVYNILSNRTDLTQYNNLVQTQMDKLKQSIQTDMKSNYPQCKIAVIDMPDLFYGGQPVKGKNGDELPDGQGSSLLPNPTNAVSVNDTVISPEPMNTGFRDDIQNQYKKLGLQSSFVDTFSYAHIGDGNLHCSTHTIQICNPKPTGTGQ